MKNTQRKPEGRDVGILPTDNFPIDINTGRLKRDRILLQDTKQGSIVLGFGRRDNLLKQVTEAESLAKEYREDENRDQRGRWTSGANSTSNSTNLGTAVAGVGSDNVADVTADILNSLPKLRSIFGSLTTGALDALGTLAATFAAPAAFLGAYFIPFGRSAVASGALPGHPDLNYHYDDDTGHFSLYNSDHEIMFTGITSGDGLIRTEDGDVIGRRIDGTVLIDSDILPDEQADDAASPDARSYAQARAQANADTSQPSLCPEPLPDRPGFKSVRSMAYQEYISTLINPDHPITPGLAVYFTNPETGKTVAFDDCYNTIGDPTEAKGPGFERMLQNKNMAGFLSIAFKKQAERQVAAAPGHQIDWYVDERGAAEFFRRVFETSKLASIRVIYAPMSMGKLYRGNCAPSSRHFKLEVMI